MCTTLQKFQNHFLIPLFILLTIISSCKATEEINPSSPTLPNPSIKCDTCPEPVPPPLPPPPPPVLICPPPPPPPCPPPPPPQEPPCDPCMSQKPPPPPQEPPCYNCVSQQPPPLTPPKVSYSPGSNLYVTGYTASDGQRVVNVMYGVVVFFILALLEVIMLY